MKLDIPSVTILHQLHYLTYVTTECASGSHFIVLFVMLSLPFDVAHFLPTLVLYIGQFVQRERNRES